MIGPYQGIFVSDLDGTLLRDGRISTDDLDALRRLGELGILRVIATGRSLYSARACLPPDFPVDYLVLSTGNQVINWQTREILRSLSLSGQEVQDICAFLRHLEVNFMVHDDFPDNHRFAYHRGKARISDFERRLAMYEAHCREEAACAKMNNASQILAIVDVGEAVLHDLIARELESHSVIRATSPLDDRSIWIEIFAQNVSKADGIMHIVNHHGLHGALMAAIGNDHNDKDMLDLAHIPFRVDDAFLDDDEKYITTPSNTSAVAFAIAHFMDILHSGMTNA